MCVRVCEATFCNALLKIFNAKLLWFWSSWSEKKELVETVGSVGPGWVFRSFFGLEAKPKCWFDRREASSSSL